MKERPIPFSAPMVRAILEGRKTQTQRVVKLPMNYSGQQLGEIKKMDTPDACWFAILAEYPNVGASFNCPYGVPGDRLWVKETFWAMPFSGRFFRQSGNAAFEDRNMAARNHTFTAYREAWKDKKPEGCEKWTPSIFMPRERSRITLEITDIRVQRLQEISGEDAEAEGVFAHIAPYNLNKVYRDQRGTKAIEYFRELWDSINAKRGFGWDTNPWVWAITFKQVTA